MAHKAFVSIAVVRAVPVCVLALGGGTRTPQEVVLSISN